MDEMYHETKIIFKTGNLKQIIKAINKFPECEILLPFHKLRENNNLNCEDIFNLAENFKYLNKQIIIYNLLEHKSQLPGTYTVTQITTMLKCCKNIICDEKGNLNIITLKKFLNNTRIRSCNIIDYITQNKYMTCEMFMKLYDAFPCLNYGFLKNMLSKKITLEFINKIRPHLYTNENLTVLCNNPHLTPEMLFALEHELGFRLMDSDNEYTNIIAQKPWSKRILHHINPKITILKNIPNINYCIFDFRLKKDLDFTCPNYQLYQKRQLYLTRENFHYTTYENVRKFIVLRLHTRRFPIQIEILLIILTLSLY